MNKTITDNFAAFHPGYYIKQYLKSQNMNQHELAKRLNTNEKTVSQLINGKIPLTEQLIEGLAIILGTSAQFWRNLNNQYLDTINQIKFEQQLTKDSAIEKQMDYKFWQNLNLVPETHQTKQKVLELRKFFHVSSLEVLKNHDFLVQYKTAVPKIKDTNIINSNAWVQTALNLGSNTSVEPINITFLKEKLPQIRSMTTQEPEIFLPNLKEIFSKAGVAFVILPNLKNCGINGAVKWLSNDKVLLALNDRRKYADIFWFALFHEIKHIFQNKRGHIIVSPQKNEAINSILDLSKLEKDADLFAQNYLIPPKLYQAFIMQNNFSAEAIVNFAKSTDLHPGIVVGRLQREHKISFNQYNNFRQQYNITN